jgi:cell division inhibitor SulA/protein ImuA
MRPCLAELLSHPLLWQTGVARANQASISTGFPELDERLPGQGWPAQGLIELLSEVPGRSELVLLAPAFARCMRSATAWVSLIAPPFEPYAPAFAGAGLDIERVMVIRTQRMAWAMEQVARSGACRFIMAWPSRIQAKSLRRLQLAAEQMQVLLVLCRQRNARGSTSPAVLRVELQSAREGMHLDIFKSRGGKVGRVCLRDVYTPSQPFGEHESIAR